VLHLPTVRPFLSFIYYFLIYLNFKLHLFNFLLISFFNVLHSYTLVSEYMEGGTLSVGITPNMTPRTYLSIMVRATPRVSCRVVGRVVR